MGHHEHKAKAPSSLRIGVLSVSTTRSLEQDTSGHWIAERARGHGHRVVDHQVVTDAVDAIRRALFQMLADSVPQAVIVTGGTGISPKDVTLEALRPLMGKELTAFGPIFAQLSYHEIGSAALMSRATAGVVGRTLIFCLPGSLKACQLGCNTLIFSELGHLQVHLAEG
jgi:molybdopterin adenylyltransferase